ncbi:MAG: tetratricopeptide repeat protein [Acidobacteriota bacterium]
MIATRVFILLTCLGLGSVAALVGQSAAPTAGSDDRPPNLLMVPSFDIDALEDEVAEQIRVQRVDLQSTLRRADSSRAAKGAAFGEMGRVFHAYGLRRQAEVCYRNALLFHTEDFRWHYLLAFLRQREGNLEGAEASYRDSLEHLPESVSARVHLGEIYLEQSRLEDAERMFSEARDLGLQNGAAEAGLGQVALSRKDYQRAVDELSRALELAPLARRLHYPLGLAYRGLGNDEKARWHLARRGDVGVRPPDPLIDDLESLKSGERVHLQRGRQAFRAGDYGAAVESYEKAVAAQPESARARVNLAAALSALGRTDEAEEELEAALLISPNNPTARFNLGTLLASRKAYALALEHLDKAARLAPKDVGIRLELARALESSGRQGEALTEYQKCRQLDPVQESAWLGEARVLTARDDWPAARQVLAEAHRTLPEAGLIAHALARLLAGAPDEAVRNGAVAVDLAKRVWDALPDPEHAATLALALAESGQCQEAAKLLAQNLGDSPTPETHAALARYAAGPPCRPPVGSP